MRYWTYLVAFMGTFVASALADSPAKETGFAARILAARQLEPNSRDAALRSIALEQSKSQDPVSALKTLAFSSSPKALANGLRQIGAIGATTPSGSTATYPSSSSAPNNTSALADTSALGNSGAAPGGSGGASLADFSSLMTLIETTVVPDTWEALGGPSTMSPYPGGILVDGDGLVQDAVVESASGLLDNIEVMLQPGDDDREPSAIQGGDRDWRLPTEFRCVSLRRLSTEIYRRRVSGISIDDAMRNFAGLSQVQYVVLVPERQDVILVGPVSGIESHKGWMRDRRSGLATMRLEHFTAAAASVFSGQPFGCTIDPSPESLARAAQASSQVRTGEVPIGLAAEALAKAIGNQDVRVFGTAGDTPLGYLMVEADRHMKQLALGLQPMPDGAPSYLDIITRHISKGPPDGQLLRLWFTGNALAVRTNEGGTVFELGGRPLRLSSETKLAAADGGRIPAPQDFRLTEFAEEFNSHYHDIASMYPIYGALQSVFGAASVAELLRRSDASSWMAAILGPMLLDDASFGQLSTPRSVASIATLHRVAYRGKRHSIIVASGGVLINTQETIEKDFRPYASLSSLNDRFETNTVQPEPNNTAQWWWDAK